MCCRPELSPDDLAHSHTRKPLWVRIAAIIAMAAAYAEHQSDLDKALNIFKGLHKGGAYKAVGGHHRSFLTRCWQHFFEHGNCSDEQRPGRPVLISNEDAQAAANLLKEGKWLSGVVHGKPVKQRVYFMTIAQAIQEVPALQAIQQRYDATAEQVYHAVKRVDPDLVRRTLSFKYEFSAEELHFRQSKAAELLGMLESMPCARRVVLERMVFIDEGGLALSSFKNKSIQVWASKQDFTMHDVVHLPHVEGQEDCKVHFILAVTAHPRFAAKNGLLYWDFTTGTDDIRRRHNKLGQTSGEPFLYMVSTSALHTTMLLYVSYRTWQYGSTSATSQDT
jgi:hypothetical protein